MTPAGYYRYPTILDENIAFVSEDDLWTVSGSGGTAVRLTSNQGRASAPAYSPDGKYLAYTGREEGHNEVYVMPAKGGESKRLTYLGAISSVVCWSRDGNTIIFASNAAQPFAKKYALWSISITGGSPQKLPYGLAHAIALGAENRTLIGRNTAEPARWKRYRGGTAGVLWVDSDGSGKFRKLQQLEGNITSPLWVKERIYFISDQNGIGNLYSATPTGGDIKQLTDHKEYFARNASTDGKSIVYHAGGDLFRLDLKTEDISKIEIAYNSTRTERNRKFVSAAKHYDSYSIHPDGHSLAVTTRGKLFSFANWEGAVDQLGTPDGVRYQNVQWLNDGESALAVSDETGEERLALFRGNSIKDFENLSEIDVGRPLQIQMSPAEDKVALSNHRHELILVDLEKHESRVIDRSEYQRLNGISWSADGKWIAYSSAETHQTYSIKLYDVEKDEVHLITPPRFRDIRPSFDPEGNYLYFLSYREFNPVYDSLYFDLNFPRGVKPYLITLRKDVKSPFIPEPIAPGESKPALSENNNSADEPSDTEVSGESDDPLQIDIDGIENRIVAFPVSEGKYLQIKGLKGKVLFTSKPIKGSLDRSLMNMETQTVLEYYDFSRQTKETVAKNVTGFEVSRKSETLVYSAKNKLRVIQVKPMKSLKNESKTGRETGWIDLNRLKVSVDPAKEWEQMFHEIWRLQREHFWTEDMSGVDWERIRMRYEPLLKRISTRSEFSDLIWEMQGELGTSHAYEMGGDYPSEPVYRQGFLAADFEFDADAGGYRVQNFVQGDPWDDESDSPLNRVGENIREGDYILAVNGQRVSGNRPPEELLVNQSGTEVHLTMRRAESDENYSAVIKTLKNETSARYRQWVEQNRNKVHDATGGRVGYVHVPNMGPVGYAEFHRYYFAEVDKESLIVDVRYNGGGHVSQLILEKLARRRIGYDVQRWGKPDPYPNESVMGPIVAVTNELAGSDGDIFSHCFKLMDIGELIGMRTWGGVIGIFPRHKLVDGSVTTQPEFSFWFEDVGWGVENYGTDPDIEVDIAPHEYAQDADPQLEKAIEVITRRLEDNPPDLPDFGNKPDLSLPT